MLYLTCIGKCLFKIFPNEGVSMSQVPFPDPGHDGEPPLPEGGARNGPARAGETPGGTPGGPPARAAPARAAPAADCPGPAARR